MSEAVDTSDDFAAWIAEIREITAKAGCPTYVDSSGEEAWREQFDTGQTPAEAWSDECSYAAEDAE